MFLKKNASYAPFKVKNPTSEYASQTYKRQCLLRIET